jgi:hypothetical protein
VNPETTSPPPRPASDSRTHFRRTLRQVMAVQVVTLLLLWLLQTRFTP